MRQRDAVDEAVSCGALEELPKDAMTTPTHCNCADPENCTQPLETKTCKRIENMTTPTNNRIEEIIVQGSAESGYGRMLDEIVTLKRDLAAAQDRAERNARDAERYRLIRDHDWNNARLTQVLFAESIKDWDRRLDEIIAAIAGEGK